MEGLILADICFSPECVELIRERLASLSWPLMICYHLPETPLLDVLYPITTVELGDKGIPVIIVVRKGISFRAVGKSSVYFFGPTLCVLMSKQASSE